MLIFALFTLGYFAGVVTTLFLFPPRTNELLEQEKDALGPILEAQSKNSEENLSPQITGFETSI